MFSPACFVCTPRCLKKRVASNDDDVSSLVSLTCSFKNITFVVLSGRSGRSRRSREVGLADAERGLDLGGVRELVGHAVPRVDHLLVLVEHHAAAPGRHVPLEIGGHVEAVEELAKVEGAHVRLAGLQGPVGEAVDALDLLPGAHDEGLVLANAEDLDAVSLGDGLEGLELALASAVGVAGEGAGEEGEDNLAALEIGEFGDLEALTHEGEVRRLVANLDGSLGGHGAADGGSGLGLCAETGGLGDGVGGGEGESGHGIRAAARGVEEFGPGGDGRGRGGTRRRRGQRRGVPGLTAELLGRVRDAGGGGGGARHPGSDATAGAKVRGHLRGTRRQSRHARAT
mmetsp:Transcript_11092/g.46277  ORF Transcript_11092/g.46277 Transcript_11092/m.46277 type:complete len:342 (+) Transcript_11092:23-1048(+)